MVKSNFTGRMRASMGRSFSMSCSCKLMVLVETTAFFRAATANKMDGIK